MKVGLVIYGSLDIMSGGYLYDRKLLAYLRSQGDTVEVVSIPPASYFPHLLQSLTFRHPPGLDIVIEDELVHPSVLLANGPSTETPVVSLVHNLHSLERRATWQNAIYRHIEKWHLNSVDGYIFNSEATQDTVAALVHQARPCVLAPPGGDRLGSLTRDAVRERLSRGGPLRLLFLANVTPLKGLHVVLEALRRLPAGTASLDVAGSVAVDARYAREMQERARRLPAAVTFHGGLEDRPLADLLRSSDALVLPSFYEGFGIAYLEGMAFGLPAVGTTAGAIPQIIRDGVNGYMVAPGDSAGLAALIRGLASDRDLLAQLSEGALAYYSACPSWDQSAEKIRGFLLEMTERSRSATTNRRK